MYGKYLSKYAVIPISGTDSQPCYYPWWLLFPPKHEKFSC